MIFLLTRQDQLEENKLHDGGPEYGGGRSNERGKNEKMSQGERKPSPPDREKERNQNVTPDHEERHAGRGVAAKKKHPDLLQ